jgi:pilus assembly protein CpaC
MTRRWLRGSPEHGGYAQEGRRVVRDAGRHQPKTRVLWGTLLRLAGLLALILSVPVAPAPAQLCSPEVRPITVLVGGTVRLQMTSRKPIKTVTNPKDAILQIRTIERDPTTILLIGDRPGITRLELEDQEGFKEVREVHVQVDMEYLNAQLRKAIPLANVQAIPSGASSVILTGYVTRAEDIPIVSAVAQSVGLQPIPNLRVAGVHQVQLDVVVALVDRSKGRNFGFNFLQNSRNEYFGSTVGNLIPAVGTVGVPGSTVQPTAFGQTISSPPGQANIFSGVVFPHSGFLGFLQALEQENLAKLLAHPRLVTLSGNPASFLVGGEQAVPVPAGLGQVGVQFEEFGTRLNFVPIVLGNGKIHLEVEPEVSTLNANAGVSIAGATVAGRTTQRIHTTIELESGQTFVIGGLIQRTVNASTNKVPVLGQIPFLGAAFSTKTFNEDEQELLVMVTPHLVDAQSCDQVVKVLPGQESRSPDDFELFLEGLLEAPRGPREVFHGGRYVPAHLNGPTAELYPCAGRTALGGAGCGGNGCSAGTGDPNLYPQPQIVSAPPVLSSPGVAANGPLNLSPPPAQAPGAEVAKTTPTAAPAAPQAGPPAPASGQTGASLTTETPAALGSPGTTVPASGPGQAAPAVPMQSGPATTPPATPPAPNRSVALPPPPVLPLLAGERP